MKNLAEVELTTTMVKGDTIIIEQGGSIKRIKFDDLLGSINSGDEQALRQVAWGVPLEINSSGEWGTLGNTTLRDEWNNAKHRYLLTNAGLAAPLADGGGYVYADGTTLDVSKGHIVTIKPRLYYLVKYNEYTQQNVLWMSQVPIGGHFIEQQVTGAFLAYNNGGVLTSRPDVIPTRSQTITTFWNQAQKNGADFGLAGYDFHRYMQMEVLSDYGSPNAQTKIGYGVGGSAGNSLYNGGFSTGETMSLGNKSGKVTISGDSCHVSLHGTEDAWNAEWEFRQNVYCGNSGNSAQDGTEVYIYDGNRLPTSAELASVPNGQYRQLTRLTNGSGSAVQKMKLGEYFDLFPAAFGGNTSQNWGVADWSNATGQVLMVGGDSDYGSSSGVGYSYSSNAWSLSSAHFGARLAYYGKVTFVDGKDIA
jgi:hypothetical protein